MDDYEDYFIAALTETSASKEHCSNSHSTILVVFLVIAVIVLFIIVFVLAVVLIVMIRRRQKNRNNTSHENEGHSCMNMATLDEPSSGKTESNNYYDMLSPKEHECTDESPSAAVCGVSQRAQSPVIIRTEVNASYDTVTSSTTDHTYTTVPMHACPKKVEAAEGKKAKRNHYY